MLPLISISGGFTTKSSNWILRFLRLWGSRWNDLRQDTEAEEYHNGFAKQINEVDCAISGTSGLSTECSETTR